jgi:predicted transcriptional regulator
MRLEKNNKNLENSVKIILKSKAKSKIYIFLLKKNGAKTEDIIKGTNLHPSTIRKLLSEMFEQKIIYRKKIKNGAVGKNPYIYHCIKPLKLLKEYLYEVEDKLNQIANLETQKKPNQNSVKIIVKERLNS